MLSCLEQSLCAIYGSVTTSTLTTGKGGAKEELAYFRYFLNQDVLRSFIDLGSVLAYSHIFWALIQGTKITGCSRS